jgi:hypothetical protein
MNFKMINQYFSGLSSIFPYLCSTIGNRIQTIPKKQIWHNPPSTIYALLLKDLQIKELGYVDIFNKKMASIVTKNGLHFVGSTDELNCSPRNIVSIRKIVSPLLSDVNVKSLSDDQIALIYNLVNRYCTEFSAYPFSPFRTSNLFRGVTFVDIGAFRGYVSLKAALKVGNEGRVLSFEPIRENADYIRAHATLNNLTNIEIVDAAVSLLEEDRIEFYRNKSQENSQVRDHLAKDAKIVSILNYSAQC